MYKVLVIEETSSLLHNSVEEYEYQDYVKAKAHFEFFFFYKEWVELRDEDNPDDTLIECGGTDLD